MAEYYCHTVSAELFLKLNFQTRNPRALGELAYGGLFLPCHIYDQLTSGHLRGPKSWCLSFPALTPEAQVLSQPVTNLGPAGQWSWVCYFLGVRMGMSRRCGGDVSVPLFAQYFLCATRYIDVSSPTPKKGLI